MVSKGKALGKGLSALIGEKPVFEERSDNGQVIHVPITKIAANPHQPRKVFTDEALAELAESIRRHGVMQPLIVVRADDLANEAIYMIAAGERRFRAAQLVGLNELPCIIRSFSPGELAEISLIENIQREDLQPLEEASAFQALIDGFAYTQEQLAENLGKSRSHIANTLRLLQLNAREQAMLTAGQISAGHARALLSVRDPQIRRELARRIADEALSVRQAEEIAKISRSEPKPKKKDPTPAYSFGEQAARKITERLMVKASVSGGNKKGKVVLEYYNEDDLQRILDILLPGEDF